MGHLTRCLALAEELSGACDFYIGCMDEGARRYLQKRLAEMPAGSTPRIRERLEDTDRFHIVLLDKWKTSTAEHAFFSRFGTVFCLDEGGDARDLAAYLIDTLPAPPGHSPPNVASLRFLGLRRSKPREVMSPISRILVSFGGEDRMDLSGAFLERVIRSRLIPASSLTLLEGPLFERRIWPEGVRVLRDVSEPGKLLDSYDLVITHFGITALEALALGVPVALLNPAHYHHILGSLLDIPQIGIGKPNLHALSNLLKNPLTFTRVLQRFAALLDEGSDVGLAAFLQSVSTGTGNRCPVCYSGNNTVTGRFSERTYYKCRICGLLYLDSFTQRTKSYEKTYFFEEYKNQYGKTYLDDFASIKKMGKQRIARIRRILGDGASGTVVDIGCAYGPFLDALRETGFKPFGVDVSPDAVKYVQGLGIPAAVGAFQTIERSLLPEAPITGVSFWYVVEHFQDLDLCLRKASALLEPGGVLAFSTPNGRGISARKDLLEFLERSPTDHFVILSPRGLARILRRYGLELKAVRVTGHHPERFPGTLGRIAGKSRVMKSLLLSVSRLFRLGDTFEAYALKRQRPQEDN
jgi:2-polyprenyl-3-methyl-5-hydroxy-6-metoxy-1,4-benzoquinol methylase